MTVRVRATDTVMATVSPDGSFTLGELRINIWPLETASAGRCVDDDQDPQRSADAAWRRQVVN